MPRRGSPKKKRVSRASGNSLADFSRRAHPVQLAENPQTRLVGGFPDRIRVTLRYADRFVMSSGVAPSQYTFAGNDLYDPNVSGTGGQPQNFDDWMTQYTRFRVHGSRARFTFGANAISSLAVISVGARQNQSTGIVVDDASRPRHHLLLVNGGKPMVTDDQSYSSREVLGQTEAQYQGTETSVGTATASPTLLWFWSLRHEAFDQSTTTVTYCWVVIDYDVEFFNRIDQTLDLSAKIERLQQILSSREERKKSILQEQKQRAESKSGPTGTPLARSAASSEGYELVDLRTVGPARLAAGYPPAKLQVGAGLGLR
jgi:hypothetical protein